MKKLVLCTLLLAGILLFAVACDDNRTSNSPAPNTPTDTQALPNVDTSDFIGEERAIDIALIKAGLTQDDVIFDRTELDRDNGIWKYEIEFRNGLIEYSADIKADDGTVLEWEKSMD